MTAAALNSGYHVAYLIGAAPVGIAIVIALRAFRSEAPATAEAPISAEPAFSEGA